jgi:hypothetical protein
MNLDALLAGIEPEGEIPPLQRWHPEQQGEMDLVIAADGRWIHEGVTITRARLVRLLSTLLWRDLDGSYWLMTPVEKLRIRVEDRPFLVVDADRDERGDWHLTTNVGDRLTLDETHRLHLGETSNGEEVPEVPVRFGLSARLGRNVYYRLVEQAETRRVGEGARELGLTSAGIWHPLGRIEDD